ncbi:hypothetical protein ACFE04_011814 [Oxalis oulophora]
MSEGTDPNAGKTFIWVTTCFLFASLIAGGVFLAMYMTLPESASTAWLATAGVSLVCLPWIFWFLTCFYRVLSRTFGFRMVCFDMGGDMNVARGVGNEGGGGGDNNNGGFEEIIEDGGSDYEKNDSNITNNAMSDYSKDVEHSSKSSTGKKVQFGEVVVLGEHNNDSNNNKTMMKKSNSTSSSSSDASDESERPLALSMAS